MSLVLFAVIVWVGGVFFGWIWRSIIADKEHNRRWNVEGCRHGIEERWHD